MNLISRLVATKRTLHPLLLRNFTAPPLRFEGTPVQSLVATRSSLWGVLNASVGKTIKYRGQDENGDTFTVDATIVNVHDTIRQIELHDNHRIWIPIRPENRKAFKRQRIHDQFASGLRRVHNQPCWTGEPSPSHNLNGAPLEIFYLEDLYAANTVEEHTKRFLLSIGVRLLARSAKETRLMSATARLHNLKVFLRSMVATKTKELTENLTVELLRRSQLSEAKINAVYEVIFEDARVDVVARERNLRLNALQQTLGRIRREVEPEVQKQLEAWLTQEPEVAGVHEELEAVKDDLHKERTGEMGTPQDGRQPLVRPF